MSGLVGNPEDTFCRVVVQLYSLCSIEILRVKLSVDYSNFT